MFDNCVYLKQSLTILCFLLFTYIDFFLNFLILLHVLDKYFLLLGIIIIICSLFYIVFAKLDYN